MGGRWHTVRSHWTRARSVYLDSGRSKEYNRSLYRGLKAQRQVRESWDRGKVYIMHQ